MVCSKCHGENLPDAVFCAECGARIEVSCSSCGATNPSGSKFCRKCGASLTTKLPKAAIRRTAPPGSVTVTADQPATIPEGERKTVTALFADIRGSMELMEDLDPEEARAIVDPALKLMMDAVHHYDGYIVQSTGDGIFALFGAPMAHEDHPQRAIHSAMRMQDEVRRYADRLRAEGRAPLQIRVGANTGEVVVRSIRTGEAKTELTAIGHPVNLASRMQTLANPGSIVIAESTRKLVEGYFTLKSLGASRVKGVAEPVKVYEVTGLGPLRTRLQRSAGRGLTKFVGRLREMDSMKHAAEQAMAGHGQIVAAMAEPGVGKSRLFYEFKAKNPSGWMVLETVSVSHGKAGAYLPVIDLLHSYFGIDPEDDARKRREKVGGKVLMLDRALEDALPYLFGLLGIVEGDDPLAGMDAPIRRRRTLDAIKRLFLRESLNQPLMLVFEDLHWIDEETRAFLNLFVDSIATAKILLLVNYRPEYTHGWGNKTYYTQLRLDPLGKESADEMLSVMLSLPLARSVAGEGKRGEEPRAGEGAGSLAPLKRLIIDKTEGNPLFMEEIVQALYEEGVLVRKQSPAGTPPPPVMLTRSLDTLKIPATVQAILASRIDRLPAVEKELLQTLAVMGTEFRLALAREVIKQPDDELNRMLNDLQLAEFIYEQPAAGDVEYTFKHALTQEVAYNSILSERRKLLHERIASAIEALFTNQLDDHVEELAHQYLRSGNAGKAVHYSRMAGQLAMQRSAYPEAIAHFTSGLKSLKGLPDDLERERAEIELQLPLFYALRYSRGIGASETREAIERAHQLCKGGADDARLSPVLEALGTYHSNLLQMAPARQAREQLLAVAERTRNPLLLARAHLAMAQTAMFMGEFAASREHMDRALAKLGSEQESLRASIIEGPSTFGIVSLWWALCLLGHPDGARKNAREDLRRWASAPAGQRVPMLLSIGMVELLVRDGRAAREHFEAAVALAAQQVPGSLSLATFHHGWALLMLGQLEEGLAEMRQIEIRTAGNLRPLPTRMFIGLAEGCLNTGRIEEALSVLDQGLTIVENTGVRMAEAELLRLKGEALLMRDPSGTSRAEDQFRRSLEVARRQSAKWWELRATTSLARLLAKQNRRDEARAMLADIYGWFTEGFDTPDLKDAKALLDELGA